MLSLLCISLMAFSATTTVQKSGSLQSTSKITNPELRAEQGSRSKFSFSSSLGYSAPIDEPFAREKPNPNGFEGDFRTTLSGSVGLRYRVNRSISVKTGTGVVFRAPFQGVEKTELSTPRVSVDYFTRFGNIQSKTEGRVDVETTERIRDMGANYTLKFGQMIKYKIGYTGFTVGGKLLYNNYLYERSYEPRDGRARRQKVGLYPQLEYRINDTFRLQTSFSLEWQNLRSSDDKGLFFPNRLVGNWLGVGTSLTDEIYFYPYISWYPTEARPKDSTFAFSLTFSVF